MALFAGVAAGAAAVAKEVWGYNRENYMYDRTMKQQADLRVFDFRINQVGQWRDDIRDITTLTSEKMSTYLVITSVLFGAGITQLTNGAYSPDVPPWLTHFYMMTLANTFGYLFLSMWFAMHASNIAQSSAVRILTQFVRLPVPTWDDLQTSRTYGFAFENLEAGNMFRVPFLGNPRSFRFGRSGRSDTEPLECIDPWCTEPRQDHADENYELQPIPVCLRRHVRLVRRAAIQYQCFDSFARASMTFGINQFIHAIVYYALGKIAHAGGCHLSASCMLIIMLAVAHNLIKLDFLICRRKASAAILLQCGGPLLVSAAVLLWAIHRGKDAVVFLTCSAYALQGIWLLFMLHICGVSCQDNGAMLPVKMRATLYLDIFGWLNKLQNPVGQSAWAAFGQVLGRDDDFLTQHAGEQFDRQFSHQELNEFERNYDVRGSLLSGDPRAPQRCSQHSASQSRDGRWKTSTASGEMPQLPDAFVSFQDGKEHEEFDLPGKIPAKVFSTATWAAALIWIVGSALPYFVFWSELKFPLAVKT
eukprot:TRINITY_DN58705_c0_g1_i1.p1 TRINITY_DN58705_c0_g1~~TRINITY_DN58705_c0_g1_i1.p1  ORF type:complete len:532 (-),score=63.18 TRINITY_DN58705_c0_g1_i1:311-1906(-)